MKTVEQNHVFPIMLTMALGSLISGMNSGLFNVALPSLMTYFQTDITTVQWLTSGYMLAAGVITPICAFLGNQFGYKRLLMTCSAAAALFSFAGGLAQHIRFLIFTRILLGLSAGLLAPLTMALLYRVIPRTKQATAAAFWTMSAMLGGTIPSVLCGVIITYASWRWLLWIMFPFCLLLLAATYAFVPAVSRSEQGPLDIFGFMLTITSSFILLFAFSNLSKWGFSPKFFLLTLLGFILLGIYVKLNWSNDQAILNLRVLRYPRYVAAVITDALTIMGMYLITFMMPLFLQKGLGCSPILTGTIMLPATLCSMMAMPFGTKILTHLGEKALAITGVTIMILGSLIFLHPWAAMPLLLVVGSMSFRCFGMGMVSLLNTNTCMAAVPPELSGHASSFVNWQKQLVGSLTTSMASNVVAFQLMASDTGTAESVAQAYLSGTGILFIISCSLILCVIPLALKYFRGKNEMKQSLQ